MVLYEYPNFRGQSFAINWTELPNLNRMGFSDRAASVRIEEVTGCSVVIRNSRAIAVRWAQASTPGCRAKSTAGLHRCTA